MRVLTDEEKCMHRVFTRAQTMGKSVFRAQRGSQDYLDLAVCWTQGWVRFSSKDERRLRTQPNRNSGYILFKVTEKGREAYEGIRTETD